MFNYIKKFHENDVGVEVDIQYLIEQKQQEIEKLKEELSERQSNQHSMRKPSHFQKNISKAIEQGKLSSVQYHIEVKKGTY